MKYRNDVFLARLTMACRSNPEERGAALIIVLGLVALISTWAINAAYEDMLSLRRAENSQNEVWAEQASQSALALSVKILREDAKETQTDDLDESWAQDTPPFNIDDGIVSAQIIDTNRFINLNTLVDQHGKAVPEVEKQIKRLFTLLELDEGLVDALIDWMDVDERSHGAGGAEDSAYYNKDYHVKNARLDRWNELRLIRGFDAKVIKLLIPVVIVREVPANGISTINLNTAGAKVLMATFPNMSLADAEALIAERPYAGVRQALQGKTWATGVSETSLSVASDIFMVRTEARFGRVVLREKFMLRRQSDGGNPGKITLLSSSRITHDMALATEENAQL